MATKEISCVARRGLSRGHAGGNPIGYRVGVDGGLEWSGLEWMVDWNGL